MTALEEITQAIDTLERLRAAGSAGTDEWKVWGASTGIRSSADYEWIVFDDGVETSRYRIAEKQNWGTSADMQMIVTLHRTIDAQLVILRAGRFLPEHERTEVGRAYEAVAEILARAVNGEAS